MNENNSNLSKKYNKTLLVRRDNMRKIKFTQKLVVTLILTIIINILAISTVNFAYQRYAGVGEATETTPRFDSPIDNPDVYSPETVEAPVTSSIIAVIVKWLRNLGVIVGVLVLTIIGVKYMLAGAAEERAQYKETLVPIVIGVVMLLGSIILISSIASLVE